MIRFMKLSGRELVPTDLYDWANWLRSDERIVGLTEVGPGISVSTVCLGLDHGFGGRPLWFETMVFNDYGSTDFQDRYETYDEAEAGHARVVEQERAKLHHDHSA